MKHINDFKRKKNTINIYEVVIDVLFVINTIVIILGTVCNAWSMLIGERSFAWSLLIGAYAFIISLGSWGFFKLFSISAESKLDASYTIEIIARSIINNKDDT